MPVVRRWSATALVAAALLVWPVRLVYAQAGDCYSSANLTHNCDFNSFTSFSPDRQIADGWNLWVEAGSLAVDQAFDSPSPPSQRFWSQGDRFTAGLWQQVSGVLPGATYLAGIVWAPHGDQCENCIERKIGIDPTGGTDPYSAAVVWGASFYDRNPFDVIRTRAVAANGTITVFVRVHNPVSHGMDEVFLDGIWLYQDTSAPVEAPAIPTAAPPTATPEPPTETPLPPPTETPLPVLPSATPTALPTSTPMPPTATAMPPTATAIPTLPPPTATREPPTTVPTIPPTQTPVPPPSATTVPPTLTASALPATATSTSLPSATPEETPSPRSSATRVPTRTPMETGTGTATVPGTRTRAQPSTPATRALASATVAKLAAAATEAGWRPVADVETVVSEAEAATASSPPRGTAPTSDRVLLVGIAGVGALLLGGGVAGWLRTRRR